MEKVHIKEKYQLNRWAKQFKQMLNRPDPQEQAVAENTDFQIQMQRGHITQQEIKRRYETDEMEQGCLVKTE